jgi:hypothetical protein
VGALEALPLPPVRLLVPWRDIEQGSLSAALALLSPLVADGATAAAHSGRVSLVFEPAWPSPGPLFAQQSARDWFAALTDAWPYWSFFACRTDVTVSHVLTLLLPGRVLQAPDGRTGWKFELDHLQPILMRLLSAQADLARRLGLAPVLNEQAIEEFLEAGRRAIR